MAKALHEKCQDSTWVFGYGSLIYKVDFPYLEREEAALEGWERRFWQGSHDHRGTPEAPGRVVTLIPVAGARCKGVAYRVEHEVFEHLDHREKNGYERHRVELEFHPSGIGAEGVVYIAPVDNFAYLGPAPLAEMASQIHRSAGPSGRNLEYLLELADALRNLDADDEHVFELEAAVRALSA